MIKNQQKMQKNRLEFLKDKLLRNYLMMEKNPTQLCMLRQECQRSMSTALMMNFQRNLFLELLNELKNQQSFKKSRWNLLSKIQAQIPTIKNFKLQGTSRQPMKLTDWLKSIKQPLNTSKSTQLSRIKKVQNQE